MRIVLKLGTSTLTHPTGNLNIRRVEELSLGLTPHLGIVSQGILIFLMFIGRVGGLTMIYAALSGSKSSAARLPQERITVG